MDTQETDAELPELGSPASERGEPGDFSDALAEVPVGPTALITGASSGLGRALALELTRHGRHLVLAARREELLREVCTQIRRQGGSASALKLDVTDALAVARRVQALERRCQGLELVIANSGIGATQAGHLLAYADVERILQTNLLGAIATLVAAIPGMVRRGRGTLVGISSLAAYRGLPGSAAYTASKAGFSTFLESLRADLSGHGIRVVTVQPGFIRTPMTEANTFPMPFLLEPEEAARILVRRLDRGALRIDFPWQISLLMGSLRLLPRPLYDLLAGFLAPVRPRPPR